MKKLFSFFALIGTAIFSSCGQTKAPAVTTETTTKSPNTMDVNTPGMDTAILGAGCFWCVEAVFQQLKGVEKVTSGYSGGKVANPTYREVCSGLTGHAEVAQIVFDPNVISFADILAAFWESHDPTTMNRQGADEGTQYRSVIFYRNEKQHEEAEFYKKKLNESGAFNGPIITEISPYKAFYKAEDYHQNYYNQNGEQPYCKLVIRPKVEKFKKAFADKLK